MAFELLYSKVQPGRQVLPAAYRHQEKIWTPVDAAASSSILGTEQIYNDLQQTFPHFYILSFLS